MRNASRTHIAYTAWHDNTSTSAAKQLPTRSTSETGPGRQKAKLQQPPSLALSLHSPLITNISDKQQQQRIGHTGYQGVEERATREPATRYV